MGKKINIHIVDSVKGGSGKSTFSAKLCYSLIKDGKSACVVDLDLLGTSWKHLYNNVIDSITYEKNKKLVYLNDLVKDYEYYKRTFYIYKLKFQYVGDELRHIPVVLANPEPKEKDFYKVSDKTNVSYSFFSNIIFQLLKELQTRGFTDIVLDMPPNSDPYADIVLMKCLKINNDFNTNLYMVSNMNIAHIKSTFEWYTNLTERPESLHIASLNDFKTITNHSRYMTNPDKYLKLSEEAKFKHHEKFVEWLDTAKPKFFIVFNDTLNRVISLEKRKDIVGSEQIDRKLKLAYYFVDFDDKFSECTDGVKVKEKEELEVIQFGNLLNITDFRLYYNLDWKKDNVK